MMSRWLWQSGSLHRARGVALLLVATVPWAASAGADPLPPAGSLFKLDLAWVSSLAPVQSVPRVVTEQPPLLSFDYAPNYVFPVAGRSPGLQFSLDPDNEEVFFGWQVEF